MAKRPTKPRGPVAYLKSQARRAGRQMLPHRVLWRLLGPGTAFPSKRSVKRSVSRKLAGRTYRMADEANLTARQRAMPPLQRGRAGAKKTAAKKQGAYAAAAQIPARNRAAAATAAKKAAPKKTAAVRKNDGSGQLNGSVILPAADLTHYRRAVDGNAVVQPGEPGRRRL
jgi:hypothetical protein